MLSGDYRFNKTQLIQVTLFCFLLGLVAAKFGLRTHITWVVASSFGLVLVWRQSQFAALALAAAAFNFGIWRGQAFLVELQPINNLIKQEVTVAGTIADDPAYNDKYQSEFHLEDLRIHHGGQWQESAGRIQVSGFPARQLERGDVVRVQGKLFPALGRRQGQISYAEIEVVGRKISLLEQVRRRFFAGMYTAVPEPEASLGLGFLVGVRTLLPETLLNHLSRTGLTHIVAVSGYNLTILVRFTRRYLMRFSKFIATASSAGLILGFIAVTGLSASIFRAAIVSSLALLAWYYGRPIKPVLLILAAAAVTAGINPNFLWTDVGWYLSFVAFYGVLMLAPALQARLFGEKELPNIAQVVIETFSAQLLVYPVIMLIFGEVSLIAFPANLLVLPIIPYAMLASFIAAVGGALLPGLAGYFGWPARLVLETITSVVEYMSAIAWAQIEITFTKAQTAVTYIAILAATAAVRWQTRDIISPYKTVVD